MQIGFIGFGNMAQALAAGLAASGALQPGQIGACARDRAKLHRNTEPHGFLAFDDAAGVAGFADVVVVAVKPYQVEAVLAQCDLYKNEGVALQEKTEKAQKSWAQREQNLQAEVAQLQEKFQKGLITSRDAQAQQESLQKRAASYQNNAQKEAQTLDEENYVFTNRAQDLLHRAVQEINGDKKYKLIINASALIDADTTLNITPAVLQKVNELYAADKKAEKK